MRIGFGARARSEMKLKLSRRSVYAGTVVALIAMVAGFALAAVPGGFTTHSVGNQNAGIVTTSGNTQYSGGFTVNLVTFAAAAGCATTGTATGGATTNVNVLLYTGSTCPQTSEWYEEVSFPLTTVTAGTTLFYINSVDTSGSGSSGTITITDVVGTGAATLNFYLDFGPTSAAMPTISSISIAATGT
jgi:hypothetical protein